MEKIQEIQNWKQEHFIAYLYMAVADSDSSISSEELLSVLRKLNYNFSHDLPPTKEDYTEIVNEVIQVMNKHTFETRQRVIAEMSNKYWLPDTLVDYIVSDLADVMMEDDLVLHSEHSMVSYIRNTLHRRDG